MILNLISWTRDWYLALLPYNILISEIFCIVVALILVIKMIKDRKKHQDNGTV